MKTLHEVASPITARAALLLELDRAPGFGLDLAERIKSRSEVVINEGSLYPALRSMENTGLIHEIDGPQKGEGRPRRHYSLTESGIAAAVKVRATLTAMVADDTPNFSCACTWCDHCDAFFMCRDCAEQECP